MAAHVRLRKHPRITYRLDPVLNLSFSQGLERPDRGVLPEPLDAAKDC